MPLKLARQLYNINLEHLCLWAVDLLLAQGLLGWLCSTCVPARSLSAGSQEMGDSQLCGSEPQPRTTEEVLSADQDMSWRRRRQRIAGQEVLRCENMVRATRFAFTSSCNRAKPVLPKISDGYRNSIDAPRQRGGKLTCLLRGLSACGDTRRLDSPPPGGRRRDTDLILAGALLPGGRRGTKPLKRTSPASSTSRSTSPARTRRSSSPTRAPTCWKIEPPEGDPLRRWTASGAPSRRTATDRSSSS